ncbi:uncharacterized protein LOC128546572 [Mercenaria mercenaria]|uniref:uncharacterized protein LOC128546572 n=1 Tax=Mercenaria mercenaria TaxID=6596 RepID=UPI00234E9B93|nr:uncharacterized protein LOC128546572 [Mercenaria mercenaria]
MSDRAELRNPLYRNWVRASLGLKYLQQGLAGFVSNLSDQRHQSHLYSYRKVTGSPAPSCTDCTADNLLPEHPRKTCIQKYRSKCFCNSPAGRRSCPNNFCSRFYDLIVLDHDERNPVWTNTNPSCWYRNHWSFARCFLATAGYSDKQLAADTDAAGLLSILINNVEFRASLDSVCNFEKARNTRNDVVHTATFEIEDKELIPIIDQFIEILQDKKSLINDAGAQQACFHLEKLRKDEVNISCQKAEELRKEAMEAIAEKKEEALRDIDKKTLESLQDIAKATTQNQKILATTQTQTVENPTTLSDKEKQELQSYLIDLYRKDYLKTDLSPLLPEVEIDVEKVYVPLKMERRRGNSAETTYIHSLDELFYCDDEQAKTIYISGDAGIGKTTFCRKLILEWCRAHSMSSHIFNSISSENTQQETDAFASITSQENKADHIGSNYDKNSTRRRSDSSDESDYFLYESDDNLFDSANSSGSSSPVLTDEEIVADVYDIAKTFETAVIDKDKSTVMKQFIFLFFISLRDTYKERSVEEMAQNQLLKTKKMRELFKILVANEPENMLYILDGLDEWAPPTPLPKHPNVTKGLPLSSCEGKFTILFTSRPWKVETLRPKLGEYDFDVNILGIEKTASKDLVWLIFEEITSDKDEIDTSAVLFLQEVEKMNIECLSSVPLLLKLLVCLWEKDHELADSQTGIYSSIISKLCSLAIKRNSDNDKFQSWISQLEGKNCTFPPSLYKHPVLLKFSALMYTLGKLSFENISPNIQGGALVFKDKDLTDHGVSEAEYELSLMIGLLSQKKVIGSLKMSPTRCISFMHKTFQEYFAALYISMVFQQNMTIVEKMRKYFSSSETIIHVLKVLTFVKEMCPALTDKVTEQIDIHEKDFIVTIERSKLTLQTNMNNNTKLVTEFFMTYQIRDISVKSSDFGKHALHFQMEMRNLQVLELHSVKMTPSAFKQMLECLPETSNGVFLKLCHVVVKNPRSGDANVHVSVTLNNLKSIEIDFMNMCGIEVQFSEHMKTMDRVKYHDVDMNEKELEQLLEHIPDSDQDIFLILSELRLKNVINVDSNTLIKRVKQSLNFKECPFETEHFRGVTFYWSKKKLTCKYIWFSEAATPVDDLFSLMKHVILDVTTVVRIKTGDSFQNTTLHYRESDLVVIWLGTELCITALMLTYIKIKDNELCELLQNEKLDRLISLELNNITVTHTSSHTQQLALACKTLKIHRGNIFSNITIRVSKAVSSIFVTDVTMTLKCFELLSDTKRDHCQFEFKNVLFTNILHSIHDSSKKQTNMQDAESLAILRRDRAKIENDLNETLVRILLDSNIESFVLDNTTLTCSSRHIGLKEVVLHHSRFWANPKGRNMYLKRVSSTESTLCLFFNSSSIQRFQHRLILDTITVTDASKGLAGKQLAVAVRDLTIKQTNLNKIILRRLSAMMDVCLEDVTLTVTAFRALLERPDVAHKHENISSIVLNNITLAETNNTYEVVKYDCSNNLTIKNTNLLDVSIIFSPKERFHFLRSMQSHTAKILLEDVTMTEEAYRQMRRNVWYLTLSRFSEELDDHNMEYSTVGSVKRKTIKRMSFS